MAADANAIFCFPKRTASKRLNFSIISIISITAMVLFFALVVSKVPCQFLKEEHNCGYNIRSNFDRVAWTKMFGIELTSKLYMHTHTYIVYYWCRLFWLLFMYRYLKKLYNKAGIKDVIIIGMIRAVYQVSNNASNLICNFHFKSRYALFWYHVRGIS